MPCEGRSLLLGGGARGPAAPRVGEDWLLLPSKPALGDSTCACWE